MDMVLSYPQEKEADSGVVAGVPPDAGSARWNCSASAPVASRGVRGARYGPLLAMFFTILAQAEDGPNSAVPEWPHAGLLAMASLDPPDMIEPVEPRLVAGAVPEDSALPATVVAAHVAADVLDTAAAASAVPIDSVGSVPGSLPGSLLAMVSGNAAPPVSALVFAVVAEPLRQPNVADIGVLPAAVATANGNLPLAQTPSDRPPRIEFQPDDEYVPAPGHGQAVLRSRYAPDEFRDAPGAVALAATGQTMRRQTLLLHVDDVTTATGMTESRTRALALALDAVLPRSGVTIQPRVQLAYRPADTATPEGARINFAGDDNATGLGVRLYGAQPTRLAGVYPFVEADWWQDSRKKALNINGTRIDADLLRGLFSFNVGAHGSTRSGVKIWFKVKGGRNAGGTVGARYRW